MGDHERIRYAVSRAAGVSDASQLGAGTSGNPDKHCLYRACDTLLLLAGDEGETIRTDASGTAEEWTQGFAGKGNDSVEAPELYTEIDGPESVPV